MARECDTGDTDQFGSVVPGFKVRGMEPERNVYDFLISVDLEFAEELRSLDVPEKQEGAAEHISGSLTHDMADVRFVDDSFLLRGLTVGFQATGLDLHKEERGRQLYATHNVDTSGEAIEIIAAVSRWEDLASHLLEDRREDDGLRADGGTEKDLSKRYDIKCSCGWSTEESSYGSAEREGMSHQNHSMGGIHTVQIIRQSDGKVMGP